MSNCLQQALHQLLDVELEHRVMKRGHRLEVTTLCLILHIKSNRVISTASWRLRVSRKTILIWVISSRNTLIGQVNYKNLQRKRTLYPKFPRKINFLMLLLKKLLKKYETVGVLPRPRVLLQNREPPKSLRIIKICSLRSYLVRGMAMQWVLVLNTEIMLTQILSVRKNLLSLNLSQPGVICPIDSLGAKRLKWKVKPALTERIQAV